MFVDRGCLSSERTAPGCCPLPRGGFYASVMLLIVSTSMTLAALVGTAHAASSVRDALSERFKPSQIEMARGSDEGHVVVKGTVLRLTADGIPAGVLRTTQLNNMSPRFQLPYYARIVDDA